MALPRVKIDFNNAALGTVVPSTDGIFGLVATAQAIGDTFVLETPYVLKGMADVAKLKIVPDTTHYKLYKTLKEFFLEVEQGAELWLMGMAENQPIKSWFELNPQTGKAPVHELLDQSAGKLSALFTCAEVSEMDIILETANLANILAREYTQKKYAPFIVLLEGICTDLVSLPDLTKYNYERVGILIGDTENTPFSIGAIGILAGRLAKNKVHVNIGRVKDGALGNTQAFIGGVPVEQFDIETLHDKGYITFRTYQGKSGYFFTDDPLACEHENDYRHISRRRVIDKAFRLTYQALSSYILDQVPLKSDGTINPIYAKQIEGDVIRVIYAGMVSQAELSAEDNSVLCQVDTTEKIASTSRLKLTVKVRPHGYNRFIEVALGFNIKNESDGI